LTQAADHSVGFGGAQLIVSGAGMSANRLHQVIGSSVVQEKYTLAKAAKRRRSEFIAGSVALLDAICQALILLSKEPAVELSENAGASTLELLCSEAQRHRLLPRRVGHRFKVRCSS
jgi:hypothetical protein